MTQPAIVGIDLGKNWFHLVGLDDAGATVLRKKMNRCAARAVRGDGPTVHRRDRVVSGFAVLGPGVHRGGSRGADPAGAIREALSESQQERLQ